MSRNDDLEEQIYFQIMDMDVPVKDAEIAAALKRLPEKKRMIILMAYFLDMTEQEIAEYLHLVQSTVHYHKADSLRLLREIME
ncbi:MAG: sigma factor-like helix-turn-helix DNA-binding protein [Blautia sp.]